MNVAVQRGVDVPCFQEARAVGVEECEGFWEGRVVVDEVGEIGGCFMGEVEWSGGGCVGG